MVAHTLVWGVRFLGSYTSDKLVYWGFFGMSSWEGLFGLFLPSIWTRLIVSDGCFVVLFLYIYHACAARATRFRKVTYSDYGTNLNV